MVDELNLTPRDHALFEKLYASHVDIITAQSCAAFILKKGWHTYIISIQSISYLRFSPAELKMFVEMRRAVADRITERLGEIRLSGW
jgi:hypothetical protein